GDPVANFASPLPRKFVESLRLGGVAFAQISLRSSVDTLELVEFTRRYRPAGFQQSGGFVEPTFRSGEPKTAGAPRLLGVSLSAGRMRPCVCGRGAAPIKACN